MERRLTEEQISKAIIEWLVNSGWKIICFDFPQSGTGVSIHPNAAIRTTKNKGALIPDIVAVKGTIALIFENKNRFVLADFIKLNDLKMGTDYSMALQNLLKDHRVFQTFYGVGLPNSKNVKRRIAEHHEKLDFAICVSTDKSVSIEFERKSIFG